MAAKEPTQVINEYVTAFGLVVDPQLGADGAVPFVGGTNENVGDVDLLLIMGGSVLSTLELAAAKRKSMSPNSKLLVVGGIGHSTPYLYTAAAQYLNQPESDFQAQPESHVMRIVLTTLGVPVDAIVVEDQSANCGENAEFAAPYIDKLLSSEHTGTRRPVVGLLQDPPMQRRALLTCSKRLRQYYAKAGDGRVPPLVVALTPANDESRLPYAHDRYISLLLGEIPRLGNDSHGYGPKGKGFLDADSPLPQEVKEAFKRVREAHPSLAGR
jgi:uncharacterized SAM-binding protein YcdF (DUF218 family)